MPSQPVCPTTTPTNHGLPPRVAMVAIYALPLFCPDVPLGVGGMETRAALLSRGLARRGVDVAFVLHPAQREIPARVDGVRLVAHRSWRTRLRAATLDRLARVKGCVSRRAGLPGVRLDRWRTSLVWDVPLWLAGEAALRSPIGVDAVYRPRPNRFWRELDRDVIVSFGVNWVSAEVVASCLGSETKSVIALASNSDLSERFVPGGRERSPDHGVANACHFALTHVDLIVAQTAEQQELLRARFGRASVLVRNPIALDEVSPPEMAARTHFLWVGRSDDFHKRPLLALEVARRCPEAKFVMVMNRRFAEIHDTVLREKPENVEIIEQVPQPEIGDYFRRAVALLSTSSRAHEGFPNTFLQAGKFGAAVLSLEVDPDGMIARHNAGLVAEGDLERLSGWTRELWQSRELAAMLAANLRRYVAEHHEAEARIDELLAHLRAL